MFYLFAEFNMLDNATFVQVSFYGLVLPPYVKFNK